MRIIYFGLLISFLFSVSCKLPEPESENSSYIEEIQRDTVRKCNLKSEELITAIKVKTPDDVEDLLTQNIELNCLGKEGKTPLYFAVLRGVKSILEKLVEAGALANLRNDDGQGAVHRASATGKYYLLVYLLENGANINLKDYTGRMPIHYASMAGNNFILDFILKFNQNINAVDLKKWTPLHYAAYTGKLSTVKYLVEKGANHMLRNKDQRIPRYVALLGRNGEYRKVAEYLKELEEEN